MSVTTFFRGRIRVKTEASLSILSSHLPPWTREEDDECFVELRTMASCFAGTTGICAVASAAGPQGAEEPVRGLIFSMVGTYTVTVTPTDAEDLTPSSPPRRTVSTRSFPHPPARLRAGSLRHGGCGDRETSIQGARPRSQEGDGRCDRDTG
jgi:hypothetical protein